MFANFKGLHGSDNTIIDLISSSYYNSEVQNDHDAPSMLIQPSLDLYSSMTDELQAGLQLTQQTKSMLSPKREAQASNKAQNLTKPPALGFKTEAEMGGDKEDDKDGDESGSDGDSNSNGNKRGKYRTYTEDEKAHIISFMSKHGIQKTLEIFSGGEHKITKRKLKSWMDSQTKVKGVKGRKSNDPARDRSLHEWCMDFQNEHGRPPSRKEATQKALELSGDPSFQASKGWLDKFSRKYNIEFTPLKIIPPRGKKKVKTTTDCEPVSATSTQASGFIDSPVKDAKMKPEEAKTKKNTILAPTKEEKAQDNLLKMNPLFGLNPSKQGFQQPQQQNHTQTQQQQQPQPQFYPQMAGNSLEGSFSAIDPNLYQTLNMDGNQGQSFAYPFGYPLDYSMQYPLNYPKVYQRPQISLNYPMNLPLNYPVGFPGNFQQRLQQMMKKETDFNIEKP